MLSCRGRISHCCQVSDQSLGHLRKTRDPSVQAVGQQWRTWSPCIRIWAGQRCRARTQPRTKGFLQRYTTDHQSLSVFPKGRYHGFEGEATSVTIPRRSTQKYRRSQRPLTSRVIVPCKQISMAEQHLVGYQVLRHAHRLPKRLVESFPASQKTFLWMGESRKSVR